MFCPKCKDEFVAGITDCPDCAVPLVEGLPPETGRVYDPVYVELVTVLETGDLGYRELKRHRKGAFDDN